MATDMAQMHTCSSVVYPPLTTRLGLREHHGRQTINLKAAGHETTSHGANKHRTADKQPITSLAKWSRAEQSRAWQSRAEQSGEEYCMLSLSVEQSLTFTSTVLCVLCDSTAYGRTRSSDLMLHCAASYRGMLRCGDPARAPGPLASDRAP